MSYLIDRLKEPSTWRGMVYLSMCFGVQIDPEHLEAIISLGTAAAGAIGVFCKG